MRLEEEAHQTRLALKSARAPGQVHKKLIFISTGLAAGTVF